MMFKKQFSVLLILMMLFTNVNAQSYYEDIKTKEITRGVTHSYIERLTDGGWQKINVITADLTDKNVDVVALFDDRGISYKDKLSAMVEDSGAVAGINADFFDTTTPAGRTSPIGIVAEGNEIISSAAHDPWMASLIEGENGINIGYFQTKIFMCTEDGSKSQILHINKYHSTQSIVLFTRDFGERTPENNDGSLEMVVEGDIVKEIVSRAEGSKIPENGYVLKVNPNINNFFNEKFRVGDKVIIETEITPEIEKIETAVGGGSVLVRDGEIIEFSHNVSGSHPRTAAGVSEKGDKLYMVTVEGREYMTPGMTQYELAQLMISLGAHNAINFDGGGSTEMAVKNAKSGKVEVVNTPSDGGERSIPVGLGVKSVGKAPYFESMVLSASKEYVCIGDYVEIWALPLDNYKNVIKIGDDLEFSADDGGVFEKNKYYPVKSGERTVKVKFENVEAEISINVLTEIANISFYPSFLPDGGGKLSLIASDSDGFKSQISPENIRWSIKEGEGSVYEGEVKAKAGTVVTAVYNDEIYEMTVGEKNRKRVLDKYNNKIEDADFIILPALLQEDTLLNLVINEKIRGIAKSEGVVFSLDGGNDSIDIKNISEKVVGNTKIITVRNDLNVVSAIQNFREFLNLTESEEKNICIYLTAGYNFDDESLKSMFDKTIKKLYNLNKNVFIISDSDENEVRIDEGIRYISLKKMPGISLDDFENTYQDAVYLKFKSVGEKLFYTEEKIFAQVN